MVEKSAFQLIVVPQGGNSARQWLGAVLHWEQCCTGSNAAQSRELTV